jgi:hypothetical protein
MTTTTAGRGRRRRFGPSGRAVGLGGRVLGAAGRAVGLIGPAGLTISLVGCGTGGLFKPPDAAGTTSGAPATAVQQHLPDAVGKGLKYAVDAAKEAGFAHFTTHDSSGRMRAQVIYTDWKVCFQTPGPGMLPTTTRVDYGVVKLAESCSAADQGLVTVTAGAVMPDLRGRSTRYAYDVLGSNASVSHKTRSGGDAHVLIDSNWEVCDQTPAPGQPYAGAPVTLVVAKYADGGCQKA